MENSSGSVPLAVVEQKKEADAYSSPRKPSETTQLLEWFQSLEARGELRAGQAAQLYQQVALFAEQQERHADFKLREEEKKHLQGVTDIRRRVGYGLMLFAAVAIIGVFWVSTVKLHEFTGLSTEFPRDRFWLLVAGQSILTFFSVYFLYQVLKASERMAMPYWWADRNPDVVRMMLGIEDMLTVGSKSAGEVAKAMAPLTEPVTRLIEVATNLLDTMKDKLKTGGSH